MFLIRNIYAERQNFGILPYKGYLKHIWAFISKGKLFHPSCLTIHPKIHKFQSQPSTYTQKPSEGHVFATLLADRALKDKRPEYIK